MSLRMLALGLVVGLGLAAWAAEEKAPQRATGKFVSATLDGEKVVWKLATDKDGEKAFELMAALTVFYREKDGQKDAFILSRELKNPPASRPDRMVAPGKFVKAEAKDGKVAVTVKVGEGEAAKDTVFLMPEQMSVHYDVEGDRLIARNVGTLNITMGEPQKKE